MKACFGILCFFVAVSFSQHQLAAGSTHRATPDYGKLTLGFEANQGRTVPRVKFFSRGSGYNAFLTDYEAVLTLATPRESSQQKTKVIRMRLLGANQKRPDFRRGGIAGQEQLLHRQRSSEVAHERGELRQGKIPKCL